MPQVRRKIRIGYWRTQDRNELDLIIGIVFQDVSIIRVLLIVCFKGIRPRAVLRLLTLAKSTYRSETCLYKRTAVDCNDVIPTYMTENLNI